MSFWLRYTIYLLLFGGGVVCGYFTAMDSGWSWAGALASLLGYIVWREQS